MLVKLSLIWVCCARHQVSMMLCWKQLATLNIHFISLFVVPLESINILISPKKSEVPSFSCKGYFHHSAIYIKCLLYLPYLKHLHKPLVSWKRHVINIGNRPSVTKYIYYDDSLNNNFFLQLLYYKWFMYNPQRIQWPPFQKVKNICLVRAQSWTKVGLLIYCIFYY